MRPACHNNGNIISEKILKIHVLLSKLRELGLLWQCSHLKVPCGVLIGQKQLALDTFIGIVLVGNSLGPNNSMPAADSKHNLKKTKTGPIYNFYVRSSVMIWGKNQTDPSEFCVYLNYPDACAFGLWL